MKIKCLLKCTSESNDYSRVFSRQKDKVQLTPGEFQARGAEVRYEEERRGELAGEQAASQQNDE